MNALALHIPKPRKKMLKPSWRYACFAMLSVLGLAEAEVASGLNKGWDAVSGEETLCG